MKNSIMAVLAGAALLLSCNRDDQPVISSNDTSSVTLKFDNFVQNQGALIPEVTIMKDGAGNPYVCNELKYIISNVALIREDGTVYQYEYNNPDKGAYIVDQSVPEATHNFVMTGIPAGDYVKVRFGLGIAPEAFTLGQQGQAAFWDRAKAKGMTWTWASGYKFVKFEGNYSDGQKNFTYHLGNMGNPAQSQTPNIYQEITLSLPQKALVRKSTAPKIHIMAAVDKFLNGNDKVTLSEDNSNAIHPSSPVIQQIVKNSGTAFFVDHVHND